MPTVTLVDFELINGNLRLHPAALNGPDGNKITIGGTQITTLSSKSNQNQMGPSLFIHKGHWPRLQI